MYLCNKCGCILDRKERFIDRKFNFCYDCNEEKNDVVWSWLIGFEDMWDMREGFGKKYCAKCGVNFTWHHKNILNFSEINKPAICDRCENDRLNIINEWINDGVC